MRMRKSVKGKTIQTGAVILLYALLLSAAFAGCILLFSRFAMHTAVDGATRLIVLPEDALGVIGSMGEVQFNVSETISMETYNRYFLQTMLLRLLPYESAVHAGYFCWILCPVGGNADLRNHFRPYVPYQYCGTACAGCDCPGQ